MIKQWLSCWTCHGKGFHKVQQKIPYEEWTDMMKIDHIVEGGFFYRLVEETCPNCNKA